MRRSYLDCSGEVRESTSKVRQLNVEDRNLHVRLDDSCGWPRGMDRPRLGTVVVRLVVSVVIACTAPASAVRDRVHFAEARSRSPSPIPAGYDGKECDAVARLWLAPAQELIEDTASSVIVPDAIVDACGSDQSCMAPQMCEPVAQVMLAPTREEPVDK